MAMQKGIAFAKKTGPWWLGGAGIAGLIDLAWRAYDANERRPETIRKRFLEAMHRPVQPFTLTPRDTFVPNKQLEARIRTPLLKRTCGVQVLYAEPGSGKSTASRQAIITLQKSGAVPGAMAIDLRGVNLDNNTSAQSLFGRILMREARIADTNHFDQSLSDIFVNKETEAYDKRYVVLLDQFELLATKFSDDDLMLLLKGLATDASRSDSYVVLITVSDKELYDKIVGTPDKNYLNGWNNSEKITPALDHTIGTTPPNEDLKAILDLHCKLNKALAQTPLASNQKLRDEMVQEANGNVGRLLRLKDTHLEEFTYNATMKQGAAK